MWPDVVGARVGRVHLAARAVLVVGEHHVDAPVSGCAWTSSGRSIGVAPTIVRAPRASIITSAWLANPFGRGSGPLAVHQGQPAHLAVRSKRGDVKGAAVEQIAVRLAVAGSNAPVGDELVDVFHARVVAGVERDAAVVAHRVGRAFVRGAAERGALHRGVVRVVGIDLDDPAEAVRLVRLLVDVEAVEIAAPSRRSVLCPLML